jgi:hypothetical protein
MRVAVVVLLGLVCASGLCGQDAKSSPRYGIVVNQDSYPQDTPKDTLASVLKAIVNQRIDYLLAQLADPEFVDKRVRDTGGQFDDLVKETSAKLAGDPTAVKELNRCLKEGQWEVNDAAATAQLKDVKDRRVFLRKVGGRWFLENRTR